MSLRRLVFGMGLGLWVLLVAGCGTTSDGAPSPATDGDTDSDSLESEDVAENEPSEAESDPNDFSGVRHDYPDGEATANSQGTIDYLLVAPAAMKEAYAPLVAWKNAKGVAASFAAMEDISKAASGRDEAEKLRNYLIDLHKKQPLRYVLLGADTPFVPHREFFVHIRRRRGILDGRQCRRGSLLRRFGRQLGRQQQRRLRRDGRQVGRSGAGAGRSSARRCARPSKPRASSPRCWGMSKTRPRTS